MEENTENAERIVTPFDELLLKYQELETKLTESEDKYVRLYADFETYKRRMIKDKEEIKNSTKISMISSILDMDNDLSIALKNIKDEAAKSGVRLIAQKLETFLKSHNIEVIQTESYDDELHEVIQVMEIGESK
jgi:molecular chaperone GrpE